MNFANLPDEVLVWIFSYFSRFEDIRRLGLVCSTWHRLAWGSLTNISLRKFPAVLEGNQFQYLLRTAPYISNLQMPNDTTDNHICKIGSLLPHVKVLNLRRCREITNVGMEYLTELKLEEVFLSTSWNISSLDFLMGSVATLKCLELRGCDQLNDDSLHSLALKVKTKQPFENLKYLDLRDCSAITDEGFIQLPELFPNLKQLDVSGCQVTLQSIQKFANFKQLKQLFLWTCQNVDDSAMEVISKYPQLTRLSILECDTISDLGFRYLGKSKTIKWLEIGSKGVSDKNVDWLLDITSLEKLDVVSNTPNITKEHLEMAIESKKPNLQWKFHILGWEDEDII